MSIRNGISTYPKTVFLFLSICILSISWVHADLTSERDAITKPSTMLTAEISSRSEPKLQAFGKSGRIRVAATLVLSASDPEKNEGKLIRVPSAKVSLRNTESGLEVDNGLTQLDGKLNLTAPEAGRYQVCWLIENVAVGCGKVFSLDKNNHYLGNLTVTPQNHYIYGVSLLQENRPCWLNDPFFEVNLVNEIALIDTGGSVASSARANVSGEYVIGIPKGNRYRVRSTCEKKEFETSEFYGDGANYKVDLPLDNYAPREVELAAFSAGKGIVRAGAGDLITARFSARDNDNDALEYQWKILPGSGSIADLKAEKEEWTLPSNPGLHKIYVMVKDNHGGYAIESLQMQVGVPNLNFSGTVIDEVSRQPVSKADIDVLGVTTTSDAQGWFSLVVPELAGDQRYPLNINHHHYATYSRVLDKSSRGNTFELIRAQVTYHDPEQPIDIHDTASSGPCGQGDRTEKSEPAKTTGEGRGCKRRNARLQLPAGALVYADQSPAKGPISLSMATLNPARRTLPGDYRAVDSNQSEVELVSFGALFAEFRDVFGKDINLKQGVEATLSIPVSDDQAPLAKATIPMWSYEEKTGLWIEEGKGALKNTTDGLTPIFTAG